MELAVQVTGSYGHVLSIARTAEAHGFAAVALADHYLTGSGDADYRMPVYDSLTQAAALGRDTERMEIVMLVSPITFRHPSVYAKTMTTIDDLSGGRFVPGIGTGWHDDEHDYFGIPYPPRAERFLLLEDALGYLHRYINDPERGYEGTHFRFRGFDVQPRARDDMRIVVGGTGPHKTPSLAGRFAGEFNIAVHDPAVVAHRVAKMRSSAEAAGRDPDAIRVTTAYRMIGGDDRAEIDDFLGEWGSQKGLTVEEMRAFVGDRIPMLTWDEHRERLADLGDQGFDRAYIKVVVKSERSFDRAARHLAAMATAS